jgi:hypothetical protein
MKRIGAWWRGLSTLHRVMFVVAALLMLPAGWMLVSNLMRGRQPAFAHADWKYVQVRRLLIYIEPSIDSDLQWVVFEPNSELVQQAGLLPLCRKVSSKVDQLQAALEPFAGIVDELPAATRLLPDVVPEVRLELTRACAHRCLRPTRLPIPPLRRGGM